MRNNVIFSMLGIILNTIIPIITYPYVTRVLGVDSLGIYNFYSSASTYLILLTNLGISIYGIREIGRFRNNVKQISRIYFELLSINLFMCLLALCFVIYVILSIANPKDSFIISWFYLSVLFTCVGADWFFVALEKQKYLLIRNVIVKLLSLVSIFLFVTDRNDLLIYVAIISLSTILVSCCNVYSVLRFVDLSECRNIHCLRHIKQLMGIFIIDISYRYLGLVDVILLGIWGSKWDVGIYSVALKVVLLCIQFFNVLATTLLPRSSFYINNSEFLEFEKLSRKSVQLICFLCVPLVIFVFYCAHYIIYFLGGADFKDSILALKILSFSILFAILYNTIIFQILYPLGRIKSIIFVNTTGIIVNTILNYILIPNYHYIGIAYSYVITFIISLIIICIINIEDVKFIFTHRMLSYLVASLVVFVFNLLVFMDTILLVALVALIYFFVLYCMKEEFCVNAILYINGIRVRFLRKNNN